MKSQQSDKPGMTCEGCKFAEYSNDVQVGCSAGRLEKFKERGEFVDGNLMRFCNMYRSEGAEITLEQAKIQVSPTFGIAIFDDGNTPNVEETINSILKVNYDLKRVGVVISVVNAEDVSRLAHLINLLHEKGSTASKLVITGSDVPSKVRYDDCFIHLRRANHLIKVPSGTIFPENLFSDINISLNEEMEKYIFFESGDIQVVSLKAMSSEYYNYENYDSALEGIRKASLTHNMVKVYEK